MCSTKRQHSSHRSIRAAKAAALGLSLLAGAHVTAAGAASPSYAWLGWFSLVPFFLVIRLWRPTGAMLIGALWGATLYASLVSQPHTDLAFSVQSLVLATAIPAAYAYLGARVTRWIGFSPILLGIGWMGVELAFVRLGLYGGLLGAAHADATILHWVGRTLGYVLVAFLVAVVNASLVSILCGVRLSMPQRCYRIRLAVCEAFPAPQTFFSFPLSAIRPSRPRAPPPTHSWMRIATAL